ncbi:MAG: hypothetical protein JRG82_11975, partial [Deltaproteobacteria bacterium]|nr:hypothetical protein [Deltaproteobacteria bacterium]
MAGRKGGSRSAQGTVRRWLAGFALLSLGAGVGVLLGAVLDGPRLLVRRWTEEVQTLELSRPRPEAPSLDEFEALQTRAEPARPAPVRPPVPAPAASKPSAPAPTARAPR